MSMVEYSRSSLSSYTESYSNSSTEIETESSSYEESLSSSKSTLNPERIISYYDYAAASSKGSLNLVDIFLQKRSKNSVEFERKRAGGLKNQKTVIKNDCPVRKNHECTCKGDSKYGINSFSSVSFDVEESEDTQSKVETSCESFLVETTRTKYFRVIEEHDNKHCCDDETCGICLKRPQRKLKARKKFKRDLNSDPANNINESKKDIEISDFDSANDSKKALGIGEGAKEVLEQKICFYKTEISLKNNKLETNYNKKHEQEKKSKIDDKFNNDSGGTGDEGTIPVAKKCERKSSGVIITEVSDPSTTSEFESELDSEGEDNSSISENLKRNKQKIDYAVGDYGNIAKQSKKDVQSTMDSNTCSEIEDYSIGTVSQNSHSVSDLHTTSISSHNSIPGNSKKDNQQHFGIQFDTNINDTKSSKKHHGKSVHFGIKSEISQSINTKFIEAEFNLNNESPKPFRSVSNVHVKFEIHESIEKLKNYSYDNRKSRLLDESNSEYAMYSDEIEPDSLMDNKHADDDTDIDESLSDIEVSCSCPSSKDEMGKAMHLNSPKFVPMRLEIIKITQPIKKLVMEYIRIPYNSFLLDLTKSQSNLNNIESHLVSYENKLISKCASGCCHLEVTLTDTESSTIAIESSPHQFEFSTKHNKIFVETELATGILSAIMEEIFLARKFNRIESLSEMKHTHNFEIPLANIAKTMRNKHREMNFATITENSSPLIRLEITSNVIEKLKNLLELKESETSNSMDWNFKSITDTDRSSIILHTFDYTKRSTTEIESDWCVSLILSSGCLNTLKQIFPKSFSITNTDMKAVEVNIIPDSFKYDNETGKMISVPLIKIGEIRPKKDTSKVLIAKPPSSPPIFKDEEWLKRELSDYELAGKDTAEIKNSESFILVECPNENLKNINEIMPDLTEIEPKSEVESQTEYITISSDELTLDITYQELLLILTKKRLKEKANGIKSEDKLRDDQKVTFTDSDIKMIVDMAKKRHHVYSSGCQNEYKSTDSVGLTLDITYQELLSILTRQKDVDSLDKDAKIKLHINNEPELKDLKLDEDERRKYMYGKKCQIEYTSSDSESPDSDKLAKAISSKTLLSDFKKPNVSLSKVQNVKEGFTKADLRNLLEYTKNNKNFECTKFPNDYFDDLPTYQELLSMLIIQKTEEDKIKSPKKLSKSLEMEVDNSNENIKAVIDSGKKLPNNYITMEDKSFEKLISGEEMLSILMKLKQDITTKKCETFESSRVHLGCDLDIISVSSNTSYDWSESVHNNNKKYTGENIRVKSQIETQKTISKTNDLKEEKIDNERFTKPTKEKVILEDFKSKIPIKMSYGVDLKKAKSNIATVKKTNPEIFEGVTLETQTSKFNNSRPKIRIETQTSKSNKKKLKLCDPSCIAKNIPIIFSDSFNDSEKFIKKRSEIKNEQNQFCMNDKIDPLKNKSKIPKAERLSDKIGGKISFTKNESSNTNIKSQNVDSSNLNTTKKGKKSVQFNSEDMSIQTPTNEEILKIVMNYKKIISENNKVDKEKNQWKNPLNVCRECEVEIKSMDYDSETSDGDLLRFLIADEKGRNIFCKNIQSLSLKDGIESISVKTDSGPSSLTDEKWKTDKSCNTCREKWLFLSKDEEKNSGNAVSGPELCDTCRKKWLSLYSKNKDQKTSDAVCDYEPCNTCRKKWLLLSKSKEQPLGDEVSSMELCSICREKWLFLSKSERLRSEEAFSGLELCNTCRENWLTLSSKGKDQKERDTVSGYEPCNECREKWLSLSNNKEQKLEDEISGLELCNTCRKKWLSLSKSKEQQLGDEVSSVELCNICREKWLSLSKSERVRSEEAFSGLESCNTCRENWLTLSSKGKDQEARDTVSGYEPCNECREKWLSLSNNKKQKLVDEISGLELCNTCRKKWLSLSKSKEQQLGDEVSSEELCNICREKWLSLSKIKEQKFYDEVSSSELCNKCREKWLSLSKSTEQKLDDGVSGSESCNTCREKWLNFLSNSRDKKLEDSLSTSETCYICFEKLLSLGNNGEQNPLDDKKKKATVNSSQSSSVKSVPLSQNQKLVEKETPSKSKIENSSFVSDSRSCDICLMEWLNRLKMKKNDITMSPSKLSCECSEKILPRSKNVSSCNCREEWLSRSKKKLGKTSCTCREEWLSLSNPKMDNTSCTCAKDWLSLSKAKVDSICEMEYTSEGSDAGTCDQCLAEWLTEMQKNKVADVKLKNSKKQIENLKSDTKMYSDSEDYSLELSDTDSDFGISGVSDLLKNNITDINDLVLDEKLSDIPDLKLYEYSTIPGITEDEEDCKCAEEFEKMTRSSMAPNEIKECCSCIIDEYDEYFFSRTPWGSTLDQATVGILRALSIFMDGSSTLNDSEPIVQNETDTGITNTIKWGIDFLRTQFLGPTISESVITLFEGINYLTNTAYGVDLPYENHSSCPKRKKYYQNQTTKTVKN